MTCTHYIACMLSLTLSLSPSLTHISQGIRFLYDKGLLNRTAEDVAIFLFVNQLDKGAIGDYLGEG